MTKRLFLIFSHQMTSEQKTSATHEMHITDFIHLPANLQQVWSNILPQAEIDLAQYIKGITTFLKQNGKKGDAVLIQGDFGAVVYLVSFCQAIGLLPVYSTTERMVHSETHNGSAVNVTKTFRHVAFREYKTFQS